MNSWPLLTLLLCNFAAIGLLPLLFFKDGQYNLRWFATGWPFFAIPIVLVLGAFGLLEPVVVVPAGLQLTSQVIAVILSAVSIALIAMTVGAHRVPLALWHQDDDAPVEIVTWGPYSRIRHPFYSSFIVAFVAALLAFPSLIVFGCLAYGTAALAVTARREERRLSGSGFGGKYQEYMATTGRFFPGIG